MESAAIVGGVLMMSPAYVETGRFNVVDTYEIGILGRHVMVREYVLADNPDQRPSPDLIYSAVALWAIEEKPIDGVFHLGPFIRLTTI